MFLKAAVIATAIWAASFGAAQADRAPNAEERTAIEATLRGDGFTEWQEVELDDGKWEVDDARNSDGHKYDVDIDSKSYVILRKDRDD